MVEANGTDGGRGTAAYIERMAGELSRMAARANLTMLVYLLDMVCEEASEAQARRGIQAQVAGEDGRIPRRLPIRKFRES
jgi:hypothetical protein